MAFKKGFVHYEIADDGLLLNLIAFNLGVEIGQILALAMILIVMGFWRRSEYFMRQSYSVNVIIMSLGFILMGDQITVYILSL